MSSKVQVQYADQGHSAELVRGERFTFGDNWSRFLSLVNESRIAEAETSLKRMLEVDDLSDRSFLDIGSGSGLFSLAARRLGARVHSFDYDPQSVACTGELKRRYFANDSDWTIAEGSALDEQYIYSLGKFDIVYSWGVLHHTGQMWKALENVVTAVADNGKLYIAIYNDTGTQSARWKHIKKTYNQLPSVLRLPFTLAVIAPREVRSIARSLITLKPGEYLRSWKSHQGRRGMNRWRDIVDWVGGYPYEVAKPEEILDFYRARKFELARLKCGGVGLGCNEYVFSKGCNAH